MTQTSNVMALDAVDAYDAFAAARAVAGMESPHQAWHLMYFGEAHMLQTTPSQGADALVTVHFAPGGGPYPGDPETDDPAGYVLIAFTTNGLSGAAARRHHSRLASAMGDWLTDRQVRWSWRFEDGPWSR